MITGLIDELKLFESMAPSDAKVIPGHGPPASMADVTAARKVLEEMRDAIQRQMASGKSLDEIRKMNPLAPWKQYYGEPCDQTKPCNHVDADFYVKSFYDALVVKGTSAH